jgi:diguanylate cyclase (GGDEF)-like protein/PAS domain S-box-containing protein
VLDPTIKLFEFLEALPDAVIIVDATGRIAHLNAGVTRLLGHTRDTLEGHHLSALIPPRLRDAHEAHFKKFVHHPVEAVLMTERPILFALARGGAEVPVSISLAPLELNGERFTVAVMRDEARLHRHLGEAVSRAETDPLTGLWNRRAALDHLARLVARKEPFALLFLDLVGFKQFNDQHGHHVGDEVLSAVAGRIRSSVRTPDAAARFGGDEFLVVMVGMRDAALLKARAQAMAERIVQPMHVRTVSRGPNVTIGAALFPDQGATVEALLQGADQAMYLAKRAGLGFCLLGEPPQRFPVSES